MPSRVLSKQRPWRKEHKEFERSGHQKFRLSCRGRKTTGGKTASPLSKSNYRDEGHPSLYRVALWVYNRACSVYQIHFNMAAYGKEDFVYGSDLSDLSDFSEDDLNVNELSDISNDSEDDGRQYCVCNEASTSEMIACDDDQCTVVWWHYDCAGLSRETIPEHSWICNRCRPASSTKKSDVASVSMEDVPESNASTSTGVASVSKGKKMSDSKAHKEKVKKAGKMAVKRPKSKFSAGDAHKKATTYVVAALDEMKEHQLFKSATYPIALCVMSLLVSLTEVTSSEEFKNFSFSTVTSLWLVVTAGDAKLLKPEAYDAMWKAFHQYRLKSVNTWISFLKSLNISHNGQFAEICYQYLLQSILYLIIKDKNTADLPEKENTPEMKPISPEEEQVLRYVAGYIPYSLNQKLKKQQNETAQTFCKFLRTWQVCVTNTAQTFLQYTNEWIVTQNRGGLFHVSDGIYLLIRSMELVSRKFLNTNDIHNFSGVDIQSILCKNILSNKPVQNYWCSITQGKINGEISEKLLEMVVFKWIKIRTKAFINVYLNLKKATNGKVSKKAEKALRKDLAKE